MATPTDLTMNREVEYSTFTEAHKDEIHENLANLYRKYIAKGYKCCYWRNGFCE